MIYFQNLRKKVGKQHDMIWKAIKTWHKQNMRINL